MVLAFKTAGGAGLIEWSDLYPPLYYICITVGPWIIQDLRADVLCKGVLELQGYHVSNFGKRIEFPSNIDSKYDLHIY